MHYSNGVEVRLGDRIRLFGGDIGLVVFSIDTDEYSAEFPREDWAYLQQGVMVRTDAGALVHIDDSHANEIKRV
jgi:hypothetical protein